jgi:hypothetical protein
MPARLIVHAIEAADLTQGTGLTPVVAAAIDIVASAILDDLASHRSPGLGYLALNRDLRSSELVRPAAPACLPS